MVLYGVIDFADEWKEIIVEQAAAYADQTIMIVVIARTKIKLMYHKR